MSILKRYSRTIVGIGVAHILSNLPPSSAVLLSEAAVNLSVNSVRQPVGTFAPSDDAVDRHPMKRKRPFVVLGRAAKWDHLSNEGGCGDFRHQAVEAELCECVKTTTGPRFLI